MMIARERVENKMRPCTAVEDVAEDMQAVDSEALDEQAKGFDEAGGASCADDGLDNHAHIGLLVAVIGTLVQEFFDDVGELLGQVLAHL